ncbi:MFS transporter [Rhodococcus sp. OK302]|uniref:MFS transporter n=1 Tax=Rhodococcus sp. OK302 TaxID=1882769 RepID=UPI000B93B6E2|nr:MFS transporter [Rhodococcus sp. OK302]OYD68491.1 putative MFS family arabinose efflux permease [Rhodococcus sp. OK302]
MISGDTQPRLGMPVVLLMAAATGLCAGGNYFNQPLLESIADHLNVSASTAAVTVTIAQVAYALGLVLLVPVGDIVDRRKLTVGLMMLAAVGQAVSGFAPNFATLAVGIAVAGVFSVAAQVLVPFAAALAEPERSGQVVGTIMSGLLIGILLARSVAGLLSGLGGWSTVYKVAAVLMVVMAVALWRVLPSDAGPREKASYAATLRSLGHLAKTLPRLRTRAAMGGLAFAAVSTVFTTMAFLLAGEYGYSDTQIGLVGLLGVAGALMATVAGRLADRGKTQLATGGALAILLLCWLPFAVGGTHLAWFLVAFVLADLALQGVHVSNQNIVYALIPAARSRVNSVYMTTYFIGAALGSAVGSVVWNAYGWSGVCVAGLTFSGATALVWLLDRRLEDTTACEAYPPAISAQQA